MDTAAKVREIVDNILQHIENMEVVDISIRQQSGIQQITVLVDTPDGVRLDECVRINKMLGRQLEAEQFMKTKYNIEVCSPGLDRILKTAEDFRRVCGKTVKLITKELVGDDRVVVGVLKQVMDDKIVLAVDKDIELKVELDNIKQARLEIRW